ncbi:MAG: efflux RND transporter permease subunit [Fibrobacterota bacterium]
MRQKIFRKIGDLVTSRPGGILVFSFILTILMVLAAARISFKTQIADMMPEELPQVNELMEIIEDYQSESTVMITVESEKKDIEAMKKCADELSGKLKKIRRIKPANPEKLSLIQKINSAKGVFPLAGVEYDTVDLVKRVDYKIDNDFIESHAMMIQKTKDLRNMVSMYKSVALPELVENINNSFEKEFIDDSENMTTLDGENQAVQGLESMRKFMAGIKEYIEESDSAGAARSVENLLTGSEYMLSPDNKMLMMVLRPAVSFNHFEDMMYLGYRIDDTLSTVMKKYPDLEIGRTGAMMLQIDENKALEKDFSIPSVIALILILIILIGSFRTWKNPFYSVFTLIISIIWVTGLLGIVLQYLNMMSAGFGIVLIGLGIDFGIHFISGFKDGREQGKSAVDSIYYMYNRVGSGVITGGMTTAIVFLSLPLTRFEAYSQMGIAMGLGIITTLFAMLILLPALIMWDNKGYSLAGNFFRKAGLGFIPSVWNTVDKTVGKIIPKKLLRSLSAPLQFGFLDSIGFAIKKMPVAVLILLISAVITVLSIIGGFNLDFEYDMMELQPKGTLSAVTQDKIIDKFEISPDQAMIKAPGIDRCREMVEKYKKIGNRTGLIGRVDAITEFLPEEEVQRENAAFIKDFKLKFKKVDPVPVLDDEDSEKLVTELRRFHKNIVEIGELSVLSMGQKNKIIRKCDQIAGKKDEDSFVLQLASLIEKYPQSSRQVNGYQRIAGPVMKEKVLEMTSTDIVTLEKLPETIKERYVNPNNDELLITVYPKSYIWNEKNLHRFNKMTARVSERITGMPVIMQLMMDLMGKKGKQAVLIGALAIALFLLFDFRSMRYTILAAVPLAAGSAWMFGLMYIFGVKLSMMNFIALPLIIGIGIDDGVHMLHRYRIEGPGSVPIVLKYTGRATLLTSLTTMIGFGSMGLASHKGIAVLGQTLFFGVGSCFLSSAFMLPAILTIMEKFQKKN